jgi:stress-induced morphogen
MSSLRHLSRPLRRLATTSTATSTRTTFRPLTSVRHYTSPAASGERAIHDKLKARFGGSKCEVEDVSGEKTITSHLLINQHSAMLTRTAALHSGGCGSFYAITLSSPAFAGLTTIKQHRLVNECLKEEVKGIHGLQVGAIMFLSDVVIKGTEPVGRARGRMLSGSNARRGWKRGAA